jgi:hypothetical protein
VVVDDVDGALTTYVATLPDGPLLVLRDTAAVIWGQAVGASVHDAVDAVAAATGAAPDDIREDVETFLTDLLGRRLLVTGPAEA